jgi:hypothetical protein
MDEKDARSNAQAFGEALVAGSVDSAIALLSDELQRNPGEIVAMLPLPATDVEIGSVDRTASGYTIVLRVIGETAQDELQTRWKDRDGAPRIVEVSHLSRTERAVPEASEVDSAAPQEASAVDAA